MLRTANRLCWPLMLAFVLALVGPAASEGAPLSTYDSYTIGDGLAWKKKYSKKPDEWFKSAEAKEIAENIMSWQTELGIWPKNTKKDTTRKRGKTKLSESGTYDNGATVPEIRFIARMYKVNKDEKYRKCIEKAMECILKSQYPNGGWPQCVPPFPRNSKSGYSRHITFNDNAMVNLMWLVRDMARHKDFDFLTKEERDKMAKAFDKGVECILRCQIKVKDPKTGEEVLTAWCQQHDEETLEPRKARIFEPAAICGFESWWIIKLLMSIDKPSPEIINSINCACKYFESTKLTGIAFNKQAGTVTKKENAKPLWARFYEIGTNRPIFAGWNGHIKYDMMEISEQRRRGYRWYHPGGTELLEEWKAWKKKHGIRDDGPTAKADSKTKADSTSESEIAKDNPKAKADGTDDDAAESKARGKTKGKARPEKKE